MNARRARVCLWSAAAVLAAGAGAIAVAAILMPVREPKVRATPSLTKPGASASAESLPPLKAFAAAWSLDLRRPLYDPPPGSVTAAKTAKPPPPLAVTLTGTVVEPGHSLAVFSAAGGKVELKAVGESAGGAEVLEIGRDTAVVWHNGEQVTLRVPKREGR